MNKLAVEFNPIDFVNKVGGLLMTMGVHEVLGDEDQVIECALYLHELASSTAYTTVKHRCWDYTSFLTHYPVFQSYFDEAEYNVEQERELLAARKRELYISAKRQRMTPKAVPFK